jgi:hypothetical protein
MPPGLSSITDERPGGEFRPGRATETVLDCRRRYVRNCRSVDASASGPYLTQSQQVTDGGQFRHDDGVVGPPVVSSMFGTGAGQMPFGASLMKARTQVDHR